MIPGGAVETDPLAALARDGGLPRDLMKLSSEMAALVRFCDGRLSGSTALGVSTVPYHEAGADPVQELGFLVATLVEYARRGGGLVDRFAQVVPEEGVVDAHADDDPDPVLEL